MEASEFWKLLNQGPLSCERMTENLSAFKSSEINFTLSMFDPATRGQRYYSTVLYMLAKAMPRDRWAKLVKITNRNLAAPMAIIYKGEPICLDYLQAVEELDFIDRHVNLDGMDILEIGAGYGRTCHTILANHDVKTYTIADLGCSLMLSSKYLRDVLEPEQYAKMAFVDVERKFLNRGFDFCLCVDAFSEMSADNITQYLKYIDKFCKWFYVKSPIGQYDVELKCLDGEITLTVNDGFDRINTLDEGEIKTQVTKFVDNFRPDNWTCVEDSNALPYMHYWNAIYRKTQ